MHAGVHLPGQGLYSARGHNHGLGCQAHWAMRKAHTTSGSATAAEQVTFRQGTAADVKGIQKMVLAERSVLQGLIRAISVKECRSWQIVCLLMQHEPPRSAA